MTSIVEVLKASLERKQMTREDFLSLQLYWVRVLERANYFELMGVDPSNDANQNKQALDKWFVRFMHLFHSDRTAHCPASVRYLIDIICKVVSGAKTTLTDQAQLDRYKRDLLKTNQSAGDSPDYVRPDTLRLETYNPTWQEFFKMTDVNKIKAFVKQYVTADSALIDDNTSKYGGIFLYCLEQNLQVHAMELLMSNQFLRVFDFEWQLHGKESKSIAFFYERLTSFINSFTDEQINQLFTVLARHVPRTERESNGRMVMLNLDPRLFERYLQNTEKFREESVQIDYLDYAEFYVEFGLTGPLQRVLKHFPLPKQRTVESNVLSRVPSALIYCPADKLPEVMELLYKSNFPFDKETLYKYFLSFRQPGGNRPEQVMIMLRYGFLMNFKHLFKSGKYASFERSLEQPQFRMTLRIYQPLLDCYALLDDLVEALITDTSIYEWIISLEFLTQLLQTAPAKTEADDRDFYALFKLVLKNLKQKLPESFHILLDNTLVLASAVFGKLNPENCPQVEFAESVEALKNQPEYSFTLGVYRFVDAPEVKLPVLYFKTKAGIQMQKLHDLNNLAPELLKAMLRKRMIAEDQLQALVDSTPLVTRSPSPAQAAVSTASTSAFFTPVTATAVAVSSTTSTASNATNNTLELRGAILDAYLAKHDPRSAIGQLHEQILHLEMPQEDTLKIANEVTLMCAYLMSNFELVAILQSMHIPVSETTARIVLLSGDIALWTAFGNYARTHGINEETRPTIDQVLNQTSEQMSRFLSPSFNRQLLEIKKDKEAFIDAVESVFPPEPVANPVIYSV